ncbi:MAG: RdgB/HAM1 family non-canonical purine NTP pyrophosphatase [Cytophagales bacterium]|nr:RdgB/HAM1 family non-canonical purine NTP pyrophosphatase [Cytophagales bacterium]
MEICFATNNQHKLDEIRQALGTSFQVLSLIDIGCHDELPETGDTLEANSREKAQYVLERYHVTCFADDSGLEVDALGGLPGAFSARYAGPERNSDKNLQKLLEAMKRETNRRAQFKTVITYCSPVLTRQFTGTVSGALLRRRSGAGGFGYDPIFKPQGQSRSFARMSMEEKNRISHRGKAVAQLLDFLLAQSHD